MIEMAAASGLSRVAPAERDAVAATSLGTGDLLRAAIDAGASLAVLGIGGSATTDGGRGLLEALGARVAADGTTVDVSGLDPRLGEVALEVACDVTNPLLGDRGAAATYGPQKGADPSQVRELDARNSRWADALERATGTVTRDVAGAGAAGGVGFALLAIGPRFAGFALRPGIELVMAATGFDERLARADLVITGEGRIDAQTAFGKTALGVATKARDARIPCIAVGGGVTPEGVAALEGLALVVPVAEEPQSVEAAMASGAAPIVRCGERIARLVDLGVTLAR
jgi:glycerate kinase